MPSILRYITLALLFFTLSLNAQTTENKMIPIEFNSMSLFQKIDNISATASGIKLAPLRKAGTIISEAIQVPITNPEPFIGISYNVYFDFINENNIAFYVRGSIDGTEWNEWMEIVLDDHGNRIPGEFMGSMVFLEKETRFIQYKIELIQTAEVLYPSIKKMRLVFISPGATPKKQLDEIDETREKIFKEEKELEQSFRMDGIESVYPRPSFVSRVTWGCPYPTGNPSNPGWVPSITIPTHLVVHHSAGPNSSNDWAAIVRSYWVLHVNTNGWSDIGYNWLIDANGVLYQGRQFHSNGSDDVLGAHFSGTNGNTMGVCVMGTYTSTSPTLNAFRSLVRILAYKASQKNIAPLGSSYHSNSGLTLNNICGHRDGVGVTECPGTNLYNQLLPVRNRVYALLNPPMVQNAVADSVSNNRVVLSGEVNPRNSQTEVYFQIGTSIYYGTTSTIQTLTTGNSYVTVTAVFDNLQPSTMYNYRMVARNADTLIATGNQTFVTVGKPLQVELFSPDDDSIIQSDSVLFIWQKGLPFAEVYKLEIDNNPEFSNPVIDSTITDTSYVLTQLENNSIYWWRVVANNSFGWGEYSSSRQFSLAISSIDNISEIPAAFGLNQNYPNPFNPSTTISYNLPKSGNVTLKVYDILGKEIAQLVNEMQSPGHHRVEFNSSNLTGGIYFYQLSTDSFLETKKMILLR